MSAPIHAVVNASPLIFLAEIGQLEQLPDGVATTPTVVDEATSGDPIDHPEVPLLDAWLGQK